MSRPDSSLESQNSSGPFAPDRIVSSVVANPDAIREMIAQSAQPDQGVLPSTVPDRPLHRLAVTRREQNISLARVARKLSLDAAEVQRQETETTDLPLSQLYRWRDILQVPVCELVIEPDEIPNNPIRNRSQLIKMMKTVRTIAETSKEEGIVILARLLIDQLVDLMPELQSVSAWPSVGQAREQRAPGQAALRRFDSMISRRLEE